MRAPKAPTDRQYPTTFRPLKVATPHRVAPPATSCRRLVRSRVRTAAARLAGVAEGILDRTAPRAVRGPCLLPRPASMGKPESPRTARRTLVTGTTAATAPAAKVQPVQAGVDG